MRTLTLSRVLVSALALAALTATGCKKRSDSGPPACALAPLDAACAAGTECCSGNCQNSLCVKPAGECGAAAPVAALCAAPSDCCTGACPAGTCVDTSSCDDLGASCAYPDDCCSGSCEGNLGAKVCTAPPQQCTELTLACSGATAQEANAQCCSGYCDAGHCASPPTPSCLDPGVTCSADSQCCSAVCDPSTDKCLGDGAMCAYPGEACGSDAQCCSHNCPNAGSPGATCSSTVCLQIDQSCATDTQCCSGICGFGSKCVAVPPGSTGSSCKTLGEACATGADCCTTNCKGGTCMAIAACDSPGDICYRDQDCCSGLCAPPVNAGEPGRCEDAPGGCGQDGVPCSADSQCCTRKCLDLGAGATACQPAGGCRMTGDYCDRTASCCGGTNPADPNQPNVYGVFCDGPGEHPGPTEWDTRTQDDRTCTGGQACNPPGNICGYKASQNCCYDGGGSGKAVCKPDANGILRCFGGPVNTTCPTGWDANDPQCCIAEGSVCQFRDQCCGFAPCVPDANGILRCAQADTCLPAGSICAPPGAATAPVPDPCCTGTTCRFVSEVGWACTTAAGTCRLQGQSCNTGNPCCFGTCTSGTCGADCAPVGSTCGSNAQCCSGMCEGGLCRTPCVAQGGGCTVNADCCSGLSCAIPPGATAGTCQSGTGPTCSATGQTCAVDGDCCSYVPGEGGDTCVGGVCTPPATCAQNGQACTAGGNECCSPLECLSYKADESTVVTCGDPLGVTPCFCDVRACAPLSAACSTLVPCCEGYCGDATGKACVTTDLTCLCRPTP